MKWIAGSAVMLTLLLAGCAKAPAPGPGPETKKRTGGEETKLVELDAASMKEVTLKVSAAIQRSIPITIRASGRLATNENTTWRVGAITDGRIVRVEVKVGDRVEKGQVLARMHSHDIHESRALYRKSMGDFNRLQGSLGFAQKQRDRVRRLFEMKAASQEQVEQAENELRTAQTALDNAAIEVNRTRLHLVEFLQIPVEGSQEKEHEASAEEHIEDLIPIRAPASGIVLVRGITPGAVVTASSDLFTICDLSTIWAIAAVQEEHLSRLHAGMAAHIQVQAYPERSFAGRVVKIDEKLDAQTRTVSVRVESDNRAGLLKPEMYATVELEAGGSEPALFVPQVAVQDVNGQATVFVERQPGRYQPHPVELGRTLEGLVQVLRGLPPGARVVGEGSFILKSQLLKSSLAEE
ncbi:MAG: efflux RND transporter periplasmic adaptor subunit [Candidatus Solibacter usitatus]|nr:efflux RND transporter periplasmic adaptor subunit [Candidatus Solibacter usitatus]